jgi:hypothetical protein
MFIGRKLYFLCVLFWGFGGVNFCAILADWACKGLAPMSDFNIGFVLALFGFEIGFNWLKMGLNWVCLGLFV